MLADIAQVDGVEAVESQDARRAGDVESRVASNVRFSLVALDCADPVGLAEFYSRLTGWPVERGDEDWWELVSPGDVTLAFQLAPDHRPPSWPAGDPPQQLHLDFDVDDLDIAEDEVLALGAVKVDHQPKPQFWRVFLDPAGHPFCLVLEPEQRNAL